jgi:hypothetical protein
MSTGPGFDIYAHLARRPDPSAACPHCGGVGNTGLHPELGLVCSLCGAPRIAMPEDTALPAGALALLKKAEAARKSRGMMRGLGIVGWIGTAFGTLLAFPFVFFSFLASVIILLLIAAPSLALALFARARSQAKSKEMSAALDQAWGTATAELVRAGKARTAADVAKALGIDAARAQHLLTLVSVDAEIGAALATEQVRIDAPPQSVVPVDPRFAALEAKVAEEQQAEAEAAAHAATVEVRPPERAK